MTEERMEEEEVDWKPQKHSNFEEKKLRIRNNQNFCLVKYRGVMPKTCL